MANFPVVPIRDPQGREENGDWPERKEIDDFVQPTNAKQVFLFFAALTELQSRPASDALSFFQLGGIHGLPYRQWPPVKGDKDDPRFMYCEHGTPQFPTWHRLYVVLFERTLYDIMKAWVHQDTKPSDSPIPPESRGEYREAALKWRLPFWDIGTRKPYNNKHLSIPKCATSETLEGMGNAWKALNSPEVKDAAPEWLRTNTRNPLYTVKYPDDRAEYGLSDEDLGSNLQTTARYPDSKGQSNIAELMQEYINSTGELRANIVRSFLLEDFNEFNGKKGAPNPNLQAAHASGHNYTGGPGGNMTYLELAGFDPLFFLHHANIDRLIALWQAGHPGDKPGFWLSADEEKATLAPFKNQNGELWNSASVRDISQLGYTYHALKGVNDARTLATRVGDLFGAEGDVIPYDVISTASFEIAEIGPFKIDFLWMKGSEKQPDSDPVVGRVINFVAKPNAPCKTCEKNREEKNTVTLSTNLSPRLTDDDLYGPNFRSMKLEAINQEVTRCHYWRVYKTQPTGDVEIPVEDFKSLRIAVQAWHNDGTFIGDGQEAGKPKSEPTRLSGATAGKPGGLEADQPLPWEQ